MLKEIENVNETSSGLNISSSVDKNEKYRKGKIVSFGSLCPKKDDGTNTIEIGQEVIYDRYKSSPVTIDGITYESIYYSDLVAIV